MLMLPVQKPMSHSTWRRGRSSACNVSRRTGILVIIFSRPSNSANSQSGMPKGVLREGRDLFRFGVAQVGAHMHQVVGISVVQHAPGYRGGRMLTIGQDAYLR